MYKCETCKYSTNRKFNLQLHNERKISCKNTNLQNVNPTLQNVNPTLQFVNPTLQNVNPNNEDEKLIEDLQLNKEYILNSKLYCDKCTTYFSSKHSLMRHHSTCSGVNKLTCPICLKTFLSRQGRCAHKTIQCVPPEHNNQANVIGDNNTVNNNFGKIVNNNINHNHNVQYNQFGDQDLSFLLKNNDLIHKTNQFSKQGMYGFIGMMDDIYLNPFFPENHCIIKNTERGSMVQIRCNENDPQDMQYREFEDIKEELVNSLKEYLELYNLDLVKQNAKLVKGSKEIERITKFLKMYLCLDGETLSFLSKFGIPEDYEMDEEEKIKNNKKFDKAALLRIFQKTQIILKDNIKLLKSR